MSLSERAQGCYGFDSYFHVSHFSKSTISYVQPGTETTNTWYCCNMSRVLPQHVCLKIYSHISNFHKSIILQLIFLFLDLIFQCVSRFYPYCLVQGHKLFVLPPVPLLNCSSAKLDFEIVSTFQHIYVHVQCIEIVQRLL